jgi:hypothetical protein
MTLVKTRSNAPKKAAIVRCNHSVMIKTITATNVIVATIACQFSITYLSTKLSSTSAGRQKFSSSSLAYERERGREGDFN